MKILLIALCLLCRNADSIADTIQTTLKVEFVSINNTIPEPVNLNISNGTYAIDAFLAGSTNPCYNINYTVSKFGAFITEVCDVAQVNGSYWYFYINDKLAPVGVSCYEVNDGDVLTLRYEINNNSSTDQGHQTTNVEVQTTLKVEFVSINNTSPAPVHLNLTNGTYAIDAFLTGSSNLCYNINYTVSKFGAFITEVCDVAQVNGSYWYFYINDKLAPVGVSCYEVQNKDVLSLQYEVFGDGGKGHETTKTPETTYAKTQETTTAKTDSFGRLSPSIALSLLSLVILQVGKDFLY